MSKHIIIVLLAVLAATAAGCGYFAAQHAKEKGKRVSLEADVAALELQNELSRAAQEVADARRQREEERSAQLQATIEDLLTGEFEDADTPIDPAITRLLDCMREAADPSRCPADTAGPTPPVPDQ